ncbi:MAG: hypothetical protein M9927_22110 [Anaerolineae bacterium]|nr:hypothetical protein [Anaerolineae bacterium]
MATDFLQETTEILTEFASTKFSSNVLEVQGPAQEGSTYRWRIISNRNKEVTVVESTKKPFLGKLTLTGIEVYGLGETKILGPNLQDLRNYLDQAELTLVR